MTAFCPLRRSELITASQPSWTAPFTGLSPSRIAATTHGINPARYRARWPVVRSEDVGVPPELARQRGTLLARPGIGQVTDPTRVLLPLPGRWRTRRPERIDSLCR